MDDKKGMFDLKLKELDRQYLRLQNYFTLCQGGDKEKIRHEIEDIKAECDNMDEILKDRACHSRSVQASKLAEAQSDYDKTIKDIVDHNSLESTALYAECAIDFAMTAVNHALLAALSAIDLQMKEENKSKKETKK